MNSLPDLARAVTVSLRSYQQRSVHLAREAYAGGARSVVLVLPCGAGKTVVAAAIIVLVLARGGAALFLVDRIELLTQAVAKLAAAGVTDVRVICAGVDDGNPGARVTVAMIPTLRGTKWLDRLPHASFVVVDECHGVLAKTHHAIVQRYPGAKILGLTATPARGDGQGLDNAFDMLVVGATVRELQALGHLVPLLTMRPKGCSEPLASGRLAMSPLEAYRQHANGRRAIVFATRVADAERYAAEMTAGGVPAGCVHGELDGGARADVLARFVAGDLRAVTNVDLWCEGTDIPAADACILACSPDHPGRLIQMGGRVLRPSPATGKRDAVLVDLCGSVLIHGTPDMDREYTLDGRGISRPDRLAIRQCGECGGVFEAGPAVCPVCGATLRGRAAAPMRVTGQGVEEVGDLPARRASVLRSNLEAIARANGFPPAWVEQTAVAIGGKRLPWVAGARPRSKKAVRA